ncbi:MAG: hypothetical protein ABSA16_11605 [Thermoguttaceae bacterium]
MDRHEGKTPDGTCYDGQGRFGPDRDYGADLYCQVSRRLKAGQRSGDRLPR